MSKTLITTMPKTFTITITLSYKNIADAKKLKRQIDNEATSWVDSGSFGDKGYCDGGELLDYKVVTTQEE